MLPSLGYSEEPVDYFNLSLEELMEVKLSVASLFVESELYTAASASRVTEEEWRRQGAQKTFDAIEHVPGVYVTDYMYGQSVPTFRGFIGSEQYNSFLTLLDGIPLNNYATSSASYGTPNFALGNLSAMEVIRGPGSALYGADAFNGVVSMNSWDSDKNTAEAWGEGGSFGYWNANARFRQQLFEGVSFTGSYSSSGQDDEKNNEDYTASRTTTLVDDTIADKYRNFTATNKLKIHNTELAFYFSEHHADDGYAAGEIDPLGVILPFLPPVASNGIHADGVGRMKAYKISHIENLPDDWSLELKAFRVEDQFLGRWGAVPGEVVSATSQIFDIQNNRNGFSSIAKKQLPNQKSKLVLGYSYDIMEVDHFISSFGPVSNVDKEMHGLMGQADIRLFDDFLQIIMGGRFDHYSDFGDHFSPRLGLVLHPDDNKALKLLYGNAFRSPSLIEKTSNAFIEGGNEGGKSLGPEEVDTYELIWLHLSNQWRYSATVYHSTVTEQITFGDPSAPVAVAGFVAQWQNAGKIVSSGVELEGSYAINSWLISGNASYNETENREPTSSDITAYPNLIANFAVRYQFNPSLHFELNHMLQHGRKTINDASALSYENESLSDLNRTDLFSSWQIIPSTELYCTVKDVFNRADTKTDINFRERGKGTPGRKLIVGIKAVF